jgi:hypothetical protein
LCLTEKGWVQNDGKIRAKMTNIIRHD